MQFFLNGYKLGDPENLAPAPGAVERELPANVDAPRRSSLTHLGGGLHFVKVLIRCS